MATAAGSIEHHLLRTTRRVSVSVGESVSGISVRAGDAMLVLVMVMVTRKQNIVATRAGTLPRWGR